MKRLYKSWVIAAMSALLVFSLINPVLADTQNPEVDTATKPAEIKVSSTKLGQVFLSGDTYVEFKNLRVLPLDNKQVVSFTVEVNNNGSSTLNFVDYWVKLRTTGGSKFTTKLIADSANKDTIAPKMKQYYTMYSLIGEEVNVKDLVFEFIEWDFDLPNYEKVIGKVTVPAHYNDAIPSGMAGSILVGNTDVQLYVSDATSELSVDENIATINLDLLNLGNRALTLPNYKYLLVSTDGTAYDATPNKTDITLQPKVKEKLELEVEVPESIVLKNMDLMVVTTDEASATDIAIGSYNIADLTKQESKDLKVLGNGIEYENKAGKYDYTLTRIQRLAWEDQDIITAQFNIANADNESIPFPTLKPVFKVDGVELDSESLQMIKLDEVLGINTGKSANILMYIKVPYTYDFSSVEVVLYDETKETEVLKEKKIGDFKAVTSQLSMPVIESDGTHSITSVGKAATVKVKEVQLYEEEHTTLFYTEVTVTNEEKRLADLAKLKAYLKTPTDTYYPMEVSEVTQKINPGRSAVLAYSAQLPSYVDTAQLMMVLGESVNEDTAYINGVTFELPGDEKDSIQTGFQPISIEPYTFAFNKIDAKLSNVLTVNFEYTVTKENRFEVYPEGHSLVMEIVDGDVQYSQVFEFEKDLLVGTYKNSMTANMNIDNIEEAYREFDGYKINLYDQYKGHKKLLGTKWITSINN